MVCCAYSFLLLPKTECFYGYLVTKRKRGLRNVRYLGLIIGFRTFSELSIKHTFLEKCKVKYRSLLTLVYFSLKNRPKK